MEVFFGWLVFAVVVGVIASNRGRSGFGWFLLSVLLSPLIGLILVLALRPPSDTAAVAPSSATHVKCPDCAEQVLREARVCKHCGCRLVPQPIVNAEDDLEKFGITRNGNWYVLDGHSYASPEEAVSAAKKSSA